jgi:hypothetical protein
MHCGPIWAGSFAARDDGVSFKADIGCSKLNANRHDNTICCCKRVIDPCVVAKREFLAKNGGLSLAVLNANDRENPRSDS